MANVAKWASQKNLSNAMPVEKSVDSQPASSESTDYHETIGALPTSEAQQTTMSLKPVKTSSNLQAARGKLGLHPSAPVVEEHDTAEHSDLWWSQVRMSLKEPFAEFWGVFFMVLFGDGSVAQVVLSTGEKSAPGGNGYGDYQSINWGWGLGVMLGIYIAGDSGAYLKYVEQLVACAAVTDIYQPGLDILELRLPQAALETLSNLLPCTIPWRISGIWSGLYQLHQRHQRFRRIW